MFNLGKRNADLIREQQELDNQMALQRLQLQQQVTFFDTSTLSGTTTITNGGNYTIVPTTTSTSGSFSIPQGTLLPNLPPPGMSSGNVWTQATIAAIRKPKTAEEAIDYAYGEMGSYNPFHRLHITHDQELRMSNLRLRLI